MIVNFAEVDLSDFDSSVLFFILTGWQGFQRCALHTSFFKRFHSTFCDRSYVVTKVRVSL